MPDECWQNQVEELRNIKRNYERMRFELRGAALHAMSPPVEPLPMAAGDARIGSRTNYWEKKSLSLAKHINCAEKYCRLREYRKEMTVCVCPTVFIACSVTATAGNRVLGWMHQRAGLYTHQL